MMKFIEKPNLPQNKVKLVICGKLPPFISQFLAEKGIDFFETEENSAADVAVRTHADMVAVHLGGNKVFVEKNQKKLIENLRGNGFDVITSQSSTDGAYPNDIGLNVALFGNFAVGNFRHTDTELLNSISDYKSISVRQGYSKCSILPVNEKAVITDDSSIYVALKTFCDVLLINKGDITLSGHDYGFVGGAAAKISKNEILFFGDITKHRDYNAIVSFLKKYGCKAVYIEGEALNDLGGFVTLKEERLDLLSNT